MNSLFMYRPKPNLYGSERYTKIEFTYGYLRRIVWSNGLPFIKGFPDCLDHPVFKALRNISSFF